MKILAIVDGKPSAAEALRAAAGLSRRLGSELGVITVRPGTHATENLAPVGVDIPAAGWLQLPVGIRALLKAADILAATGLMVPLSSIKLRDVPHGHIFFGVKPTGERILFSERFGSLIGELNQEIAESHYNLVVVAAPRRGTFGRFISANIPRRLALDLDCSFLALRGGHLESRFLVCADGSPSARRIFPLLKKLLPALRGPADLICVQRPGAGVEEIAQASHCLELAEAWLSGCGRAVRVLRPQGAKRAEPILEAAGSDSLIIMGESHHHDIRRRTVGVLPLKVLARTDSSFLWVKHATEPDPEMFEEEVRCSPPSE